MFINKINKEKSKNIFEKVINLWLNFKLKNKVINKRDTHKELLKKIVIPLNKEWESLEHIISTFENDILPYCSNFSSPNFMWFPDAGNSVAGIAGNILSDFLQQNLINQSFCSPSATFVEIATISWLREIVGYKNNLYSEIDDVDDVWWVITWWWTTSNAIAILLAREHNMKWTMKKWLYENQKKYIIIPKWIGHYSIRCSQMWLWMGFNLIEVETKNFCYDLEDLESKLVQYSKKNGEIIALIAYAWDSRTMAVDNFEEIFSLTKKINPNIRLHADACHGFSLWCSKKLKGKLKGIEKFDSITTDPHKVFNLPYVISALLLKDPKNINTISVPSDLITKDKFSFWQTTPFIGSKPWMSLKLWFFMKNLGKEWLDNLIENRHNIALLFAKKIENNPNFILLNQVWINSVMFMYTGRKNNFENVEEQVSYLNTLNKKIYSYLLEEWVFYVHSFPIPDSWYFKKDISLNVLRFMSWNPNLTEEILDNILDHIQNIWSTFISK